MRTTIEMAREAAGDDWGLFQEYMPEIHRLVELVRADERARMTDRPKIRPVESEYASQVAYTRALEAYCDGLAEQPAQQEPLAWQVEIFVDGKWTPLGNPQRSKAKAEALASNPSILKEHQRIFPVYTSPPAQRTWVGLTNNELQPIADEYRILFGSWVEDFARAIEAKLKEKNT